MAKLEYKTLGQSNPQGKTKIWFCAHGEDSGKYFEEISNQILAPRKNLDFNKNCAIWYDSEPSAPFDSSELISALSEMNLFVVIVTKKFLTEDNRARNFEFKYAAEHNIAILPLMKESGLSELFNEKCGNIQFIEQDEFDSTAIPYEEKLTKFLSSVIIGDKLAQRIRAEFDAQVFLSYRKIDRIHAQKLMKAIHSIDLFRDVAIWYDEFLVPGDDFNDSIVQSLKNSRAFVLTVTPNAVAKSVDKFGNSCENYIVTTEYPLARANLPIVPVELIPTDRTALGEKYEDLPEIVSAEDTELFTRSLSQALTGVDLLAKKGNHEHDYLIGLAYLTGTDVEIDRERGLTLIESAAEGGFDEAIDRLVMIYKTGDGVKADIYKAIEWKTKKADGEKKLLDATKDLDFGGPNIFLPRYTMEMHDLSTMYLNAGDYDRAEQIFNELISVNQQDGRVHPETLAVLMLEFNKELGNIHGMNRNFEKAEEYLNIALNYASELLADNSRPTNLYSAASILSSLGSISQRVADFEKAAGYYYQAMVLLEEAVKKIDAGESPFSIFVDERIIRLHHSACCRQYAAMLPFVKSDESVDEYYEKAVKINKELSEGRDDNVSTINLLESMAGFMSYQMLQGNMEAAKEYYRDIIAMLDDIGEIEGYDSDLVHFSDVYRAIAEYCEKMGMATEADGYYLKAIKYAEHGNVNHQIIEYKNDLAYDYYMYGKFLYSVKNYAEAKFYLLKALEMIDSIIDKGDPTLLDPLQSSVNFCLGLVYKYEGSAENAEECFLATIAYLTGIEIEKTEYEVETLAKAYGCIASIALDGGDLKKAYKYYMKSLDISEEMQSKYPGEFAYNSTCLCCTRLAKICREEYNYEGEEIFLCRKVDGAKRLVMLSDTNESKIELSSAYIDLGLAYSYYEKYARAEDAYTNATALAEAVNTSEITPVGIKHLFACYHAMGTVKKERNDFIAAEEYMLKAASVCREIINSGIDTDMGSTLSACYYFLGKLFRKAQNYEKAKEYYLQAISLNEKLMEEHPSVELLKMSLGFYDELCEVSEDGTYEYLRKSLDILRVLSNALPNNYEYAQRMYEVMNILGESNQIEQDRGSFIDEGEIRSPDALYRSALSQLNLGDKHLSVRNLGQATACYGKAAEILDQLAALYPDDHSYTESAELARYKLSSAALPPASEDKNDQKPRGIFSGLFKRKNKK